MFGEGNSEEEAAPVKRSNPKVIQLVRKLEEARDEEALLNLLNPQHISLHSIVARRLAAKAVANIARPACLPTLVQYLEEESDRAIRLSLLGALGRLGNDFALPMLLKSLKDRDALVRLEAATALSKFNSPAAFEALLAALQQKEEPSDRAIRQFAAEALGQLADRRAVAALLEALKDEESLVRTAVAKALGQLGDRAAIPLLKRLRHTTPHLRGADCAECKAIDVALTALEK
ncbi:MAG: HEAT repeat domain-containing protein [Chloroflexota bacterium]